MNKTVAVIVPVYKADISDDEKRSLASIVNKLSARDIYIVKPTGLDVSWLTEQYPALKIKEFEPRFFAGIKGYNQLMCSADFYGAFSEYEYMLIAQLDTLIFADELDRWCAAGYDYVGAPWLKRRVNCYPPMTWIKWYQDRQRKKRNLYSKRALYNRVGNGGLSLRRIEPHCLICLSERAEIERLNNIGVKGQPEDVFWSTRPSFAYPTAEEALEFAFDKYPALCYRRNGRRLPMGCHGWTSRKMRGFWNRMTRRGELPV